MLETQIAHNLSKYIDVMKLLNEDHYTYDGDEGVIYDEYPFDEYNWATGASKICIIVNNIVFKTSFSGYAYDYDYEESDYYEEPIFENWDRDYCLMEYQLYQLACKWGVEKFFAETVKVMPYVYAQPRCDEIFGEPSKNFHLKDNTNTDDWMLIIHELGLDSLKLKLGSPNFRYFAAVYPIDELLKLQNFLDFYEINDLHGHNFGWFDGELKFFDFCGYNSDTFEKLSQS